MNRRLLVLLVCTLSLAACSSSERATQPAAPEPAVPALDPAFLAEPLGLDADVRTGTLPNGLTYYVRRNAEPQRRAELRLAINAGSVLEDEDQRGLAHFVEHMAFNGTERFEKQELVDYLEGIGMRFGPDLNAYTSFDETVYLLQVPTDSAGLLDTGFDVLKEWASAITFEDEEIDKERGVVLEEWRLGRGAQARINDEQLPVLLGGSRYAERLPIGDPDVLRNAPYETLRRFYETWYRPDLMAVVAVGDFDPDAVEQTIRATFGGLTNPPAPTPRPAFDVPGHDETRFVISTDPELSTTSAAVYYKEPADRSGDVASFRRRLMDRLYNRMLNSRLYELTQRPDAPYLGAFTGKFGFARPSEFYVMQAVVSDGGVPAGLEALLTEAARVERHGFTASELARTKADVLREYEVAFNERTTTESRAFAGEYVDLFLEGVPAPGIAREYALVQALLPSISLADLDTLADEVVGEENRVVTVSAPDKEGVAVPTEADLRAVFAAVGTKDIEPYEDAVSAEPLVASPPAPGVIESVSRYEDETGVTEWTLENGVRVVLKPTDFKNDEVLFSAFSPGGTSLAADGAFRSAQQASAVVSLGGVGAFSAVDLDKKLAGQAVRVQPYVDEREEGLVGSASPEDLETLFQLVHLYFTAPREDADAFDAFRQRIAGVLQNRSARPEAAFSDTLQVTLAQYHPRRAPFTLATIPELELDEALAFYRDRFRDASDFTFVFVGAFEPDSLEPLVRQYLATLPATGRVEAPRDLGVRAPEGVVTKTVRRGIEPKARVQLVFSGTLDARVDTLAYADSVLINDAWVPVADSIYAARHAAARGERYLLGALADALAIRLRESLREDLGGVYGVGVNANVDRMQGTYTISIGFGSDPGRVDELTAAVFEEIERFKQDGPDDALQKVKEGDRRAQELALRENGTWLGALGAAYRYDEAPTDYLDKSDLIDALSYGALRGAAQFYLDESRYVQVVLLPEE
ncbi:MAG: insulinase family protein [Rhodothermales bacterium]